MAQLPIGLRSDGGQAELPSLVAKWQLFCNNALEDLTRSYGHSTSTFERRSAAFVEDGGLLTALSEYSTALDESMTLLEHLCQAHQGHASRINSLREDIKATGTLAGHVRDPEPFTILPGLNRFMGFLIGIQILCTRQKKKQARERQDLDTRPGPLSTTVNMHGFYDNISSQTSDFSIDLSEGVSYDALRAELATNLHIRASAITSDFSENDRISQNTYIYVQWAYCKLVGKETTEVINMDGGGRGGNDLLRPDLLPIQTIVYFGYSSIQNLTKPWYLPPSLADEDAFRRRFRSEIHAKLRLNFENRRYIPSGDISPFSTPEVIKKSVQGLRKASDMTAIASEIAARAPRLHAACVYSGQPLTLLVALLRAGFDDLNLPVPASVEMLEPEEKSALPVFLETVPAFFALHLNGDCTFWDLSRESIMPVHFDWREDRIGSGAFAEVYKVYIEPTHHKLSPAVNRPFALKVFSGFVGAVSEAFAEEKATLDHLRRQPHPNLVIDLASWTQGNRYYILYPLASGNLRDFMATTSPELSSTFVQWLLDQFIAVASAICHIHNFPSFTSGQVSTGFHHDIKPENILVFTDVNHRAVWKLSDFGTAKVSTVQKSGSGRENSRYASHIHGTITYAGPDSRMNGFISRPFDMWSFGCVMLEVLVWALMKDHFLDDANGFATLRAEDSSDPYNLSDVFWLEDKGMFDLKPSVKEVIQLLLGKYCAGREEFIDLVICIQGLLQIDPKQRMTAERLVEYLNAIRSRFLRYMNPRSENLNSDQADHRSGELDGALRLGPSTQESIHFESKQFITTGNQEIGLGRVNTSHEVEDASTALAKRLSYPDTAGDPLLQTPNLLSKQSQFAIGQDLRKSRRVSERNSRRDRRLTHLSPENPITEKVLASAVHRDYRDAVISSNPSLPQANASRASQATSRTLPIPDLSSVDLGSLPQVRKILQDPEGHQQELQYEESNLFEKLQRLGIFDESYVDRNVITFDKIDLRTAFKQIADVAQTLCDALVELKDVEDSEISYSVLVEDSSREKVCNVVPVSLESLQALLDLFVYTETLVDSETRPSASGETAMHNTTQLKAAIDCVCETMIATLDYLGIRHKGHPVRESESMNIAQSILLTRSTLRILAVGLLSYVSSHIGSLDQTIFPQGCDQFLSITSLESCTVYFCQRPLTCLAGFLGADVNMFLTKPELGRRINYDVSTLLADFDDLWGPVQIIYATEDESLAASVNTFGGTIAASAVSKGPASAGAEDEIVCHWSQWGHASGNSINFNPVQKLLIGATISLFRENEECDPEKQSTYMTWPSGGLGTTDPSKKKTGNTRSLGLTIPFTGLTGNRARQTQIIPGVNVKNVLFNWYVNKYQGLNDKWNPGHDYFDQVVGLELSKCTGNGQRLTFWDLLRIPDMIRFINRQYDGLYEQWAAFSTWESFWKSPCVSKEQRLSMENAASNIISLLMETGVDANGNLSAWVIGGNEVRRWRPDWAPMLKDGVFAVLSSRCLIYEHGRRCCNKVVTVPNASSAMMTRIQVEAKVSIDGKEVLPHHFQKEETSISNPGPRQAQIGEVNVSGALQSPQPTHTMTIANIHTDGRTDLRDSSSQSTAKLTLHHSNGSFATSRSGRTRYTIGGQEDSISRSGQGGQTATSVAPRPKPTILERYDKEASMSSSFYDSAHSSGQIPLVGYQSLMNTSFSTTDSWASNLPLSRAPTTSQTLSANAPSAESSTLPLVAKPSAAVKIQKASRDKAKTLTERLQQVKMDKLGDKPLNKAAMWRSTRHSKRDEARPNEAEAPIELGSLYDVLQEVIINHKYWTLDSERGRLEFCVQQQEGQIKFDVEMSFSEKPIQMIWRGRGFLDPTERLKTFDVVYKKGDQQVKEKYQALRKLLGQATEVKVTFKFREARVVHQCAARSALKWVCVMHQTPEMA